METPIPTRTTPAPSTTWAYSARDRGVGYCPTITSITGELGCMTIVYDREHGQIALVRNYADFETCVWHVDPWISAELIRITGLICKAYGLTPPAADLITRIFSRC